MKEKLAEKVLEVRRNSIIVIVVVMVIGKVKVRVNAGCALQQNRKEDETGKRSRMSLSSC